jgi:hypothetical protein
MFNTHKFPPATMKLFGKPRTPDRGRHYSEKFFAKPAVASSSAPKVAASSFAHLAGQVARIKAEKAKARQKLEAEAKPEATADKSQAVRRPDAAQERGETVRPQGGGDITVLVRNTETAANTASRIITAAACARSGGPTPTAPTGMAREILEAAALRNVGGHTREKPTGLAAEILAAGEKRRNIGSTK